ncbi:MAG TPA: hypothetical protein VGG03_04610 [Thermoanaerobaculia bacterium]|jgi:hypothetical protein
MTTLRDFDVQTLFDVVKDRSALELVQRVIQAEVVFHESRLGQLRELNEAVGKRLNTLGGG